MGGNKKEKKKDCFLGFFCGWEIDDQIDERRSSCREIFERERGKKREKERKEMTRYEVNGCFFCVKYM